ncbi:MFS transporter [Streptomyces lydicus]|uniref:MFS transporter n=1 Tax=Streptomyces lydicus TaxID=47763 RepID=UPI0036860037
MTIVRDLRALPAAARLLLLASGVNAFGSGLVLPLLVVYLVQGQGFGVSVATGAIATTSVTAFAGGLVAGWAADKVGSVRTVFAALTLAAAGSGLYGLVSVPWHALLAAAVFGLGVGGTSVWQGLFAEAVEAEQRPIVFGAHFGLSNAALGVGGIVAGSIVTSSDLWTFRSLYLVNAATFVVAGLVTIRSARGLPSRGDDRERSEGRTSYRTVLANRPLLAVLLITLLLFTVGYSQLESGVPAVLIAVSHVQASDLAMMFVADALFAVIAQVALMSVIKRLSHRVSLTIAALSWSVLWALLLVATHVTSKALVLTLVCAGVAAASVGAAFYSMAGPTLVNAAATHADRGRANAVSGIATSVGMTAGPLAAGMSTGNGMARYFVAGALAATIGTAVLTRMLRLPGTMAATAAEGPDRAELRLEPEAV